MAEEVRRMVDGVVLAGEVEGSLMLIEIVVDIGYIRMRVDGRSGMRFRIERAEVEVEMVK